MSIQPNHGKAWMGRTSERCDWPLRSAPSISTATVFRQLILDEVRSGRLTAWRRRRIVRYAAGMGLSAVEVGRLIRDCRAQAEGDDESIHDGQGLRLAPPVEDGSSAHFWYRRLPYMISVCVLLALVIHRLILLG